MKQENVNHPRHYNSHPAGIECINVIRHYTCDIANALKYLWRAGLKPEMGMEDAEKEIEDLKKALWYIEDFQQHQCQDVTICSSSQMKNFVQLQTGYSCTMISKGYVTEVSRAIKFLLMVGLIGGDGLLAEKMFMADLELAMANIQQRILDIEHQLLDKELKSTAKAMNAFMTGQPIEAVDGEDYVSKPGCVRETEPEHYDPLNMIVAWGRVYSLTDEVRKKPNGALYSPCDNCDLIEVCYDDWRHPDTSVCHDLCRLHQAKTNEYYREVGVAKYAPSLGTVEVVDEHKELQKELGEMKKDDEQ